MYKLYIVEAFFVCYTYHIRQPIAHGGDEMTENKNGEILKDITINDVAKALNLSKTTVSRAISGKGRVSEATRNLVLSYAKEHNYMPNAIARSLAHSKTFNIGVVIPSDADAAETPFFQRVLMGICETAASRDYDVLVAASSEHDISSLKRMVINHKVDGVILTRSLKHDSPVEFLKQMNVPFVVIGETVDKNAVQVDNDMTAACSEMTSILIRMGIKSIALIVGNLEYIVNRRRYDGFMRGFLECDRIADQSIIFQNAGSMPMVDSAVSKILKKNVDCIITGDDLICGRVLTKLREKNISVPGEIKVASFYNSFMLENNNPPITSINIDVHALGGTAATTLIKLISGGSVQRKIIMNHEILLKKSTV